jgi:glycosyltransferase involved in cell wall biosynthesis
LKEDFPVTAFIIFSSGAFGGAEKRFTNLFIHLNTIYPGKFRLIINPLMESHLKRIFPGLPFENIHVIDRNNTRDENTNNDSEPRIFQDTIPDPYSIDAEASLPRKYFWYFKNKRKQKKLFTEIDLLKQKLSIEVFIGIFAGGLPLVFYLDNPTRPAIIFSDMDSWFTDVLTDIKKLWYRKYYSFNYILENADAVDFLSPYIAEGVLQRGVSIDKEKIHIAPASFVDYSKCVPGDKTKFEIAFAARLEPDKNPMLFLEAAKEILQDFPETGFRLMGEGSLVNEVKNFIDSNDLAGKISFTFHKNPPEVFAATSVFVSLQSGTNYPSQSVLEAMACSNAIIASNTGDTSLFINANNGILVKLEKNSLIEAMKKLIKNKELTAKLGSTARAFVMEHHTIDKVSGYYTELIRKTLAVKRKAA